MNQVNLCGNIGNAPELRTTLKGTTVTNIRLATHEAYRSNGKREEVTQWHRLVFFGKIAEIVHKYTGKGDRLLIKNGRLEYRKWEDKDGITRYTAEVICRDVEFLTPKKNSNVPSSYEQEETDTPPDYTPPPSTTGDDVPF